ncbi:MAG TPA: MarR family transcriptional regulator [Candidatus Acidoferrum sp.]|jgi:DNA-binding MarR family transcriptional regulator
MPANAKELKYARFEVNTGGENKESGWDYSETGEWRGEALLSLLFRTSIRLQTTFDRCFEQFGLTAQEAAVLLACVGAQELSAGKLAQAMGRDKSKITRFVDRLVAARLLIRKNDPHDHRLLIIRPTKRGQRIAPQLAVMFGDARKQFFDGILAADAERLVSVLSQLCANAGHFR